MTTSRTATHPGPRSRKRRPERRDEIRRAALELFRECGFHSTSMVEIGKRLNLSGPAIYRHFANKEEILCSAIEQHFEEVAAETQRIAREATSPREALERLVAAGIRHVLDDPELAVAVMREKAFLSEKTRSFLGRVQRHLVEDWVHFVAQLRPDLNDAEARATVLGVMGMLQWMVQFDLGLSEAEVERRMREMALGTILWEPSRRR